MLLICRLLFLDSSLLIFIIEMEHAVFGQGVLSHFKVELGKGFLLGLEWYLGGMHALHPHDGYALRKNAEIPCSAVGEVDDASASVRTAVGDTHNDLFAVAFVGDAQQCAEGIGAVGAGETVVMQALSAACARARGTFRIERSLACLRLSADKGKAYCCKNY